MQNLRQKAFRYSKTSTSLQTVTSGSLLKNSFLMYCAHGASCCESPLKELGLSVRLPDGLSTSGSQVSSNSMNSAGQYKASPTPGINQGSPEGFQSDGTAFQDSGQPGHGAGPPKTQPFCLHHSRLRKAQGDNESH